MITQSVKCEKVGKTVTLKAVTARQLHLLPIYKGGEKYDEEGNLTSIDYDGEFEVTVGDTVTVKRQRFRVHKITKMRTEKGVHVNGYYLHTAVLNKSSMFVLPLLGFNRAYFRWNFDFMNCFVRTEDNKEEFIYLWYKFTPSQEMEDLEEKLIGHPNYVDQEDVDEYHVLYKFSVPEKYKEDYRKILKGKYSYITDVAKERILDFHFSAKDRPLGKILYRDPSRRKKMESDLGVSIPEELDLHDPFYAEEEFFYNHYRIPKAVL